jgi:hypothetical protein
MTPASPAASTLLQQLHTLAIRMLIPSAQISRWSLTLVFHLLDDSAIGMNMGDLAVGVTGRTATAAIRKRFIEGTHGCPRELVLSHGGWNGLRIGPFTGTHPSSLPYRVGVGVGVLLPGPVGMSIDGTIVLFIPGRHSFTPNVRKSQKHLTKHTSSGSSCLWIDG